jgi:glyoxylase-like metal-dependent hydrolase (beta-lactamase superfamily II)
MSSQHLGDFGDFSLTVVVTSPPWYENCYIVHHRPSGAVAVVDPGGDADRILAAVAASGGRPEVILLTHGHPDHLGAANALETAWTVPTRAHADEAPVIARSSDLNRSFTGEPLVAPARMEVFAAEPKLTLGGVPVGVINCPGHTPGGVCFDFGGFVLTGDTLFCQGVGRTDLPGGNEQKLWDSINRLLRQVTDDEVMLFSGHGPGWNAGDARRWWRMVA